MFVCFVYAKCLFFYIYSTYRISVTHSVPTDSFFHILANPQTTLLSYIYPPDHPSINIYCFHTVVQRTWILDPDPYGPKNQCCGSGLDPYSMGSLDPDPGGQKWPFLIKKIGYIFVSSEFFPSFWSSKHLDPDPMNPDPQYCSKPMIHRCSLSISTQIPGDRKSSRNIQHKAIVKVLKSCRWFFTHFIKPIYSLLLLAAWVYNQFLHFLAK